MKSWFMKHAMDIFWCCLSLLLLLVSTSQWKSIIAPDLEVGHVTKLHSHWTRSHRSCVNQAIQRQEDSRKKLCSCPLNWMQWWETFKENTATKWSQGWDIWRQQSPPMSSSPYCSKLKTELVLVQCFPDFSFSFNIFI